MRSEPAAGVFAGFSAQPRATLYTTSVSKAEILYGIAMLPEGRRRLALAAAAEAMFADDFEGRVLPFDEAAAVDYAEIVAARRREGRPIETFDPDRRHGARRRRWARHPRQREFRGLRPYPGQLLGGAVKRDGLKCHSDLVQIGLCGALPEVVCE